MSASLFRSEGHPSEDPDGGTSELGAEPGVDSGTPDAGAVPNGRSAGNCCRPKVRPSAGRRHGGVSTPCSNPAPVLGHELSLFAQPFTRVRSCESAPLPPVEAPVSPECPDSSTACSSLAPAEATVSLQWR
nr:hypothetical protein Ade03nite_50880 [Actinoplanes derwentensis]